MTKLASFLLLLLALLISCQDEAARKAEAAALRDPNRLMSALEQRKAAEPIPPLEADALLELLPSQVAGFDSVQRQGGTFRGPSRAQFSEVGRLFFTPQGDFLRVNLADYAADPEGFERLWEAYLQARRGKPGLKVIDEKVASFSWQQDHPLAQRNLGIAFRYHLSLQTNLPAADSLFEQVLSSISLQAFPP
jgi:hypothetical protein